MNDNDTLARLTTEVGRVLNQASIDPDVAIGELGFDSMRVVELMLLCDQIYAASIDPESLNLTQFTTLRALDQQFRAAAGKPVAAVTTH